LFYWWNTTTNDIFVCQNGSATPLVWWKQVSSLNIESTLSSLGFSPPVARSRTQRSSPAFSTSYRPSTTTDTEINITLNFTGLVSLNSQVDIQTSIDNSTWVTIFPVKTTVSLALNTNYPITFTLPVGSYYRLVQSVGTQATIVSIYELTV
jgi:hypothetical protein